MKPTKTKVDNRVTVNGKPLEVHLDDVLREEIGEVRKTENAVKLLHSRATPHNGNVSGERSSNGQVIYVSGQPETHIIIAGIMFPWAEKAPYVVSGHSVLGAVEYDEATDRVKCHECGEWWEAVGQHSARTHGVKARRYKTKHGLTNKTALWTPRLSGILRTRIASSDFLKMVKMNCGDNLIKARKARAIIPQADKSSTGSGAEKANLNARCKAQLSERIKSVYSELGGTPNQLELERRLGVNLSTIRRTFGLQISDVLRLLGLATRNKGRTPGSIPKLYSDEVLLEQVRASASFLGRLPQVKEVNHGTAAWKRFGGSWKNTLTAAGLIPASRQRASA